MWTTYASGLNFWIREGRKLSTCSQLCSTLDAPENKPPVHQRPQRHSWICLSRRKQQKTWKKVADQMHEREHMHMCQTTWLFLLILYVLDCRVIFYNRLCFYKCSLGPNATSRNMFYFFLSKVSLRFSRRPDMSRRIVFPMGRFCSSCLNSGIFSF
jgi:hypothetical protein